MTQKSLGWVRSWAVFTSARNCSFLGRVEFLINRVIQPLNAVFSVLHLAHEPWHKFDASLFSVRVFVGQYMVRWHMTWVYIRMLLVINRTWSVFVPRRKLSVSILVQCWNSDLYFWYRWINVSVSLIILGNSKIEGLDSASQVILYKWSWGITSLSSVQIFSLV